MLALLDMVTKSYLEQISSTAMIATSVQNMPFIFNGNKTVSQLLNILGATLFPLALSLLLPVFMYSIVVEKEDKLIQIMKMNGMEMLKYWATHFIFDMGFYYCMVFVYFIYGYFVLDISYFT